MYFTHFIAILEFYTFYSYIRILQLIIKWNIKNVCNMLLCICIEKMYIKSFEKKYFFKWEQWIILLILKRIFIFCKNGKDLILHFT